MKIHHASSENMIGEILDLAQLCHREDDVQKVLDLLCEKISIIMHSDVCSIYFLDPQTKELVLRATKGLEQVAVGQVHMKVGEGLVGKTLEWLKPVSMASGRKSKSFKFFPGTGEEKFSSFLSVPLIYNRHPIGVLVIQNEAATHYSNGDIQILMTMAIPAVNVIEKAKLLDKFGRIKGRLDDIVASKDREGAVAPKRDTELMHVGVGAASGLAMASVKIIHRSLHKKLVIPSPETLHPEVEKMRLLESFRWVEEEIRSVQKKAKKKFGLEELAIFDAYRMVLESDPFKEQIIDKINEGNSALSAVEEVVNLYTEQLSNAEDDYIRERAYDIKDVGRKISDRLLYGGEVPRGQMNMGEPAILMSEFWSISDFVEIDPDKTLGLLCPQGGKSSHVAILAESLGIPAVLGLSTFSNYIQDGDLVIMDGSSGMVVVNPTEATKKTYDKELKQHETISEEYKKYAHKKAIPANGKRIVIGANMGIIADLDAALENGAEEIGLYRTEFPFLIRRSLPTEEEQFILYRKVVETMKTQSVTIRTLDIGGDKYLPYLNLPKEENPFLGWRSIRICLEREDLFRIQLRAMLRASHYGKLRILIPMISSIEEIRRVKDILSDVKKELKSEKTPFAKNIPLGMMIEVPSAAEMADDFIKEVDFFSIGTNDLVQYTLAVDRNNSKVAKMYTPLHPAVLRLVQKTIRAAHKAKKTVGVCGDMAAQPMGVLLLVGMGVDNLSMSTPLIAKVKNLINRLDLPSLKKLTKKVLTKSTSQEVQGELIAYLDEKKLQQFIPHASLLPET